MSKHYDVVVLGGSIGALFAAALLARRSWRVLVLGHGYARQRYEALGHDLARRPFSLLAHASPAFGRALVELAQSQTFRRHVSQSDPMFAFLSPNFRIELAPDRELFAREIDREFSEVRRVVDDLYAELARANAITDAAFERDVVLPPGSFWERREVSRLVASLPHTHEGVELAAELSKDHPYRDVVSIPAEFASHLAAPLPAFALGRLHGAWTRGVARLTGGEDELTDFFLERVRAHGGDTRMGDRAGVLVHRGGKVRGVRVDGEEEPYGVTFVVTDRPAAHLTELAEGFGPKQSVTDRLPKLVPVGARFVVSLVVRDGGVPDMLPRESFLVPTSRRSLPVVHLQSMPGKAPETTLLVAEAILPHGADLQRARDAMLCTLEEHIPFLAEHVVLCDSPHDGRPLWDFRSGKRADVPRVRLRGGGAQLEAEPMIPVYRPDPPSFLGLGGEPLRAPLANAFVVGPTVLPALGQEGEIVAAWSAARIITRTDRRKEKMRRDMWSKVELG
jgi:phytoene dehydrogenase-like protein